MKKKTFRSYQKRSIDLMLKVKRILLCLDMGLGKTASCLETVKILKKQGKVKKVLIVGPKYVASRTWPEEIQDEEWDFKDLTYSVIVGTPKQREKAMKKDVDIYMVNKENLVWLYEFNKSFCNSIDFLIFDESSALKGAKVKTNTSKMSRYKATMLISKNTEYVSLLTGTPTPNGIQDLYGQVNVLHEGFLGKSKWEFMNKYFNNVSRTTQFPIYVIKEGAKEEILDKIKGFMFQLKSEEVLELPEALYTIRKIELNKEAQKIYDSIYNDYSYESKDLTIFCENNSKRNQLLKQISSEGLYEEEELGKNKTHHFGDNKVKMIREIVEEATSGVLVFYSYKFEKEKIAKEFGDDVFVSDENLTKFKNRDLPVLFAHPAQIGHGINIQQGGCNVIWMSMTDNLEYYQQSNKRLHRSGQKESFVNIIHLISTKKEEDLYHLINTKGVTQDEIIKYMNSI